MRPLVSSIRLSVAIAVVAFVATANAQLAPDAAALFAEARGHGDRAAWRRIAVLHREGTIHDGGLDGAYEANDDTRDGRSDERATYPTFANRDVFDGRVAWHQDDSGGVHRHDGAYARRRSASDAWLVRRGWLRDDADGAWASPVTRSGDADLVTVVPRGGCAMDLWFDRRTRDLVRIVKTTPTTTETTAYDDFRDVAGVRLPFAIDVESDGDASSIRIARYDVRGAATFAAPTMPDDTRIGASPVTLPLDLANGVLTIEARIDGHGPFRFIFDTGGHSIVSPAVATALGLAVSGAGQSGGAGEGTVIERHARVARVDLGGRDGRGVDAGGVTLTDQHFYVIDLGYPTFERGREPPIAGVLGLEVLERLATTIDYRARRLAFDTFARHRFARDAVVTPITFDDDIPLVDAVLDGHAGVFALDSGNSGSTVVQHRWAERVGLAQRMKTGLASASYGAGGLSPSWVSRLGRFEIGGVVLDRPLGRYAEDRRGSFASRTEAGNIGTDVLAHFTIDLDYRRGAIGWRAVPGYVQPPFPRGGLRLLKDRPQDALVVAVSDDSPASAAGLRAKDRIVAIDGVPTTDLSGADIAEVFRREPGTPLSVTVLRDDATFETKLVLRELLP